MNTIISGPLSRLVNVSTPDIIKMRIECERVGAINLAAGTCEFPPPPALVERAQRAMLNDGNIYSQPSGIPELREAVSRKLGRDNGIYADPDRNVLITVGATAGFAATIMGLLEPGSGVILFEPYYAWHMNATLIAQCVPSFVRLTAPRYEINYEALERALTSQSRAIVLCNPSNPTGRVFTINELRVVAAFAEKHNLLVISDEAYEYMVFDGREHISTASLPELGNRVVTIMTASKTYNVTGWRIGYVVASPERIRAIGLVHDAFYTCAATPLQYGVIAGLEMPISYYQDLRVCYQRRRDILVAALREAKFDPLVPEGACFVLSRFGRHKFPSSQEAAMAILGRARVATVPGTAFSTLGSDERVIRLCFGRNDAELGEACSRIAELRNLLEG